MTERLEVEAKIRVPDASRVKSALAKAGAEQRPGTEGRQLEDNILYDGSDGRLARDGKVLRLRRVGSRVTFTYKEPPPGPRKVDAEVKTQIERECAVSSFEEMAAILRGLGLVPAYRYQKYREEFAMTGAAIMLDETPIGTFVEIEAAPDRIREVARALGLQDGPLLSQSYRALHAEHCAKEGLAAGDMVFEDGGPVP